MPFMSVRLWLVVRPADSLGLRPRDKFVARLGMVVALLIREVISLLKMKSDLHQSNNGATNIALYAGITQLERFLFIYA